MSDAIELRVRAEPLKDLCARVFERIGVAEPDARITADVLVTADLCGVASHGVAHLRRYVDGLRDGTINARPQERVMVENPVTATMDAGAGLGPPVSYRAMQKAIEKAREFGAGLLKIKMENGYGVL